MNDDSQQQPTGFEDDSPSAKTSLEGKPKKKKGGKAVIAVVLVAFLALAGYAGYTMFLAPSEPVKTAPAKKKPKPAAEPAAPAADPAAAPADPAQAIDPATGLPVAAPAAPAIDPVTGLPVAAPVAEIDPATGLPVAAPAAPAIDPATGLPSAQPSLPVSTTVAPAVDPAAPVVTPVAEQPAPAAPTQPVASVEPVQAAPAPAPAAAPAASDDVFAQFRDMLAPIDGRVTKLEQDVGSLKSAVEKIQQNLGLSGSKKPVTKKKVAMKKKPATSTKSAKKEPAASAPSTARPPVSTFIVDPVTGRVVSSSGQASVEPAQEQPKQASSSCTIEAIIPGRAWVKTSSNDLTSFGEGEKWIDGRLIDQIDPTQGIMVAGSWVCN